MISGSENIIRTISEERYQGKAFLLLLLIVCLFKIPVILTSDIQPWDEGMYAVRVLSIHINGDFFDQSMNSVAGLDSGSHPPLFIWLGYFATLIFGINDVVLKLLPFTFALLCVVFIIRIGKELGSFETGFLSALIFTGTYLFNVFSNRFQFDIPVTFFMIISFYFFILYINKNAKSFLALSGIAFGLCLMTKALVGFYIPIILFISFFFLRKKIKMRFSDLAILTAIGLLIALPWHFFMLDKYGGEFINFLFGFHLYSRAIESHIGIQPKGDLYYLSLLMNNIPFGIIVFMSLVKDFKKFIHLNWEKIFLWIWFITGFITISVFQTKIETYLLPFLAPACILLVIYLISENNKSLHEKTIILILTLFNIAWYATESFRNEIKEYLSHQGYLEITIIIISIAVAVLITYHIFKSLLSKINFRSTFVVVIIVFFLSANIYFLFNSLFFDKGFGLSEIKDEVERSNREKIVYISTDFKFNPQFTYYFEGIDLGWKNKMSYDLVDLKNGVENARVRLGDLKPGEGAVIVERDNLNPGTYYDSKLFVPDRFKLLKKYHGYELYED
ncbi:MAG: glycosyltransferase family 39 protein [Ignavibacteria bacterium]|nr:glycosyltransferase family 39 protein [Ignavibacteria bacterium]